jgi:hypothetical protein
MVHLWLLVTVLALLGVPNPTLAWGPEGHKVVAMIADKYVSHTALVRAQAILGGSSLEDVANWADEIRKERRETAPWHYINIPRDANAIDGARDCPNDNCVTAQIVRFTAVLKDTNADPTARQEALKFIVHFVGDLHQPLHDEDNHDKGGSQRIVIIFGRTESLHAVWGSGILDHDDSNAERLAATLEGRITLSNKANWVHSTVEDWALEGHKIAQQIAYGDLPSGPTSDLEQSYEDVAAPAEEVQLEKAGVRLANILNEALK